MGMGVSFGEGEADHVSPSVTEVKEMCRFFTAPTRRHGVESYDFSMFTAHVRL